MKKNLDFSKFKSFYERNYKISLLLPLILLLISGISIFETILDDGTPINRGVSLKGGLSSILTVESTLTQEEFLQKITFDNSQNSFRISEVFEEGKRTGFIVDTDMEETIFLEYVENLFETKFVLGDNYVSNFIAPSLSNAFFKQAVIILLISFVFMSAVVFFYFREFVPSGAVVLSVIFDVIVTIGILNLFNFQFSIAGIGALLMLIGYSIDTDVLLTNRLIKERGEDYFEKYYFAFKTGLLMTSTTLIAGIAALILTNSSVIFEISLILVIGLLVDFVSTWLQNGPILLWWIEKKKN